MFINSFKVSFKIYVIQINYLLHAFTIVQNDRGSGCIYSMAKARHQRGSRLITSRWKEGKCNGVKPPDRSCALDEHPLLPYDNKVWLQCGHFLLHVPPIDHLVSKMGRQPNWYCIPKCMHGGVGRWPIKLKVIRDLKYKSWFENNKSNY